MKRFGFVLPIGVLLLLLLFVGGCKSDPKTSPVTGEADSIPVDGGCVRILQPSDPDGLHPFNTITGNASTIKETIYMYLGNYNPQTLKLEPTLATEVGVVSPDGLRYSYEMRPEARWDNGDPVTAEDFAFSVKCQLNPMGDNAASRSTYGFIEDVVLDPQNPRKFTVVTNSPFFMAELFIASIEVISHAFYDASGAMQNYSVSQLSHPDAAVLADSALARFSREFNDIRYSREPEFIYGCGPYRLKSWTTGDNVTLEKKPDWWGNALRGKSCYYTAYPQQLIFKTVMDPATYGSVAKNEEVDIVQFVPNDDFLASREDTAGFIAQHFRAEAPPAYNFAYLGFNCKPGPGRKPLLSDLRVRQAMAHLIDIDHVIENFYGGLAEPQWGPISPLKKDEYDASLKRPAFDTQAAAALLDAAGWQDSDGDGVRDQSVKGKRIPLEMNLILGSSGGAGKQIAEMLRDQAGKIGVEILITFATGAELSDHLKNRDFDMVLGAMGANHLPTDLTQLWHSENWANGGSNHWGFGNAETDSLIAQIRITPAAEDRKPLYRRFQALWVEQLPMVTLVCPKNRLWIHKRLQGLQPTVLKPGFKVIDAWVPKASQLCQ